MAGLHDAAAFQTKLIEFQSKLIDANNAAFAAQDERSSMLEHIRELQEQMANLKAWEAEKQRYELHRFDPGVFAFSLKPDAAAAEPIHQICAACYQNGKKSILQAIPELQIRYRVYLCPECKTKFAYGPQSQLPSRRQAENDFDPFSGR